MLSVLLSDSLSGKRRERKARKLARLLVALDQTANERVPELSAAQPDVAERLPLAASDRRPDQAAAASSGSACSSALNASDS